MRIVGPLLRVLVVAALAAPLRAGVLVVDPAGGGDFTQLQAAVDAAAEGDTLLVALPGWPPVAVPYSPAPPCTVDGKSLVIVCDRPPGSTERASIGALSVRNLAAGQRVLLRGLRAVPPLGATLAGLTVTDCAGTVWIEDCQLSGSPGTSDQGCVCSQLESVLGAAGLRVSGSPRVTVVRSKLYGGAGSAGVVPQGSCGFPFGTFFQKPSDSGAGAVVENSSVAFQECGLFGAWLLGGDACGESADAGDGLQVSSSAVLLSGCQVEASFTLEGSGQDGDGIVASADATVELLDTQIVLDGDGVPLNATPGVVSEYSGIRRSFALTSPLREGQGGTLAMQGVQGDFVGFFWSLQNGALSMPARKGWFVLSTSFLAGPFLVGAIAGPSGSWNLSITGPLLPAAAEAQTFLLQAYFQYPGGATLSSGTAFTLVDAAF